MRMEYNLSEDELCKAFSLRANHIGLKKLRSLNWNILIYLLAQFRYKNMYILFIQTVSCIKT